MANAFPPLSPAERDRGLCYWAVQLLAMNSILHTLNGLLPTPLSEAVLNFLFFLLNFLLVSLILRRFLRENLAPLKANPLRCLGAVLMGLAGYFLLKYSVLWIVQRISPAFQNANDASIARMVQAHPVLMGIGTVLLVPLAEEGFYRGMVFRSLYDSHPYSAFLISAALFSVIHILGFLDSCSPTQLALSFLTYLPAGFCLAGSYRLSGSIYVPILMHAIINAQALWAMR